MPERAVREGFAAVALLLAELGLPGGPEDREMAIPGSEPEVMCQVENLMDLLAMWGTYCRHAAQMAYTSCKYQSHMLNIRGERATTLPLLISPGTPRLLHACPLAHCWTG